MMLRVSSPLCGSRVEYALDAVFIEYICQDKMQVVQFLQLFSLDL